MNTTKSHATPEKIDSKKHETSNTDEYISVISPLSGKVFGEIKVTSEKALEETIAGSAEAQKEWAKIPLNRRAGFMMQFRELLHKNSDDLVEMIHHENGKTRDEARAGLLKGIESVEFAAALPQMISGSVQEVSRGVECKTLRSPLGVVAGITPFNFPAMIPLWMFPLALTLGNGFILKPSEKTPFTAVELSKLLEKTGFPPGLFSVIQGDKHVAGLLCDHPNISALAFVGSSPVAKTIYARASQQGKRVRCMGGAKNHLTIVPDADPEIAAANIVASVTGCAGQRCMAGSVLLAVGNVNHIIAKIYQMMSKIIPGRDIGPVISAEARERIFGFLERAHREGAELTLDGRKSPIEGNKEGFYVGPSIIDHAYPEHEAVTEEIFGPVLTIIRVHSLEEAIEIENRSIYGNAATIYTQTGGVAEYFIERVNAGMVGVNVGVPVPRDPFSFGGRGESRFGDGDITGESAVEFWSGIKKVTTKWEAGRYIDWMS